MTDLRTAAQAVLTLHEKLGGHRLVERDEWTNLRAALASPSITAPESVAVVRPWPPYYGEFAADLDPLEKAIDDYIDGYETRGDDGDYTPTDAERYLIKDSVMGLLVDADFERLYATTQPASAHTDHPARHWGRTCPACIAEPAPGDDRSAFEAYVNGDGDRYVHPALKENFWAAWQARAAAPAALPAGWAALYEAANQALAYAAWHGEISARGDRMSALSDALFALDGGVYLPALAAAQQEQP